MLWGRIPVKAQAGHAAQIDPARQRGAQIASRMLQSIDHLGRALGALQGRSVNVGERQFAIHGDVCDEDTLQAGILHLLDHHLG